MTPVYTVDWHRHGPTLAIESLREWLLTSNSRPRLRSAPHSPLLQPALFRPLRTTRLRSGRFPVTDQPVHTARPGHTGRADLLSAFLDVATEITAKATPNYRVNTGHTGGRSRRVGSRLIIWLSPMPDPTDGQGLV